MIEVNKYTKYYLFRDKGQRGAGTSIILVVDCTFNHDHRTVHQVLFIRRMKGCVSLGAT